MDKVWQPSTMAPAGQEPAGAEKPEDEGAKPKPAEEAKSSKPRTLYIKRRLLNADEFLRWAKAQGFKSTLVAAELHVTIAFSRSPVDWMELGEAWGNSDGTLTVRAGGPRVVEGIGKEGAVALKFASSELAWRHMQIRECGASWDWPEYQPHVTITYNADGIDPAKVEPFRGELRFGPEVFQEIDDNWRDRTDIRPKEE